VNLKPLPFFFCFAYQVFLLPFPFLVLLLTQLPPSPFPLPLAGPWGLCFETPLCVFFPPCATYPVKFCPWLVTVFPRFIRYRDLLQESLPTVVPLLPFFLSQPPKYVSQLKKTKTSLRLTPLSLNSPFFPLFFLSWRLQIFDLLCNPRSGFLKRHVSGFLTASFHSAFFIFYFYFLCPKKLSRNKHIVSSPGLWRFLCQKAENPQTTDVFEQS